MPWRVKGGLWHEKCGKMEFGKLEISTLSTKVTIPLTPRFELRTTVMLAQWLPTVMLRRSPCNNNTYNNDYYYYYYYHYHYY